ncbi:hypothetical protein A2Z33_03870 [Candidatus Gottesmanbacteria bacterium RBG_16_52_11]|uniref:Methyltransferase type 11 domain-containing protein n=1 Tax=Candidatus Gottesmanbacteria bacterium RBG_16_52_11 TaxID=1798374 RepID=A0A1F5YVP1_9BACT|nr:MAG: hypothetical protein A2Z33_03870 [Candidatus Gottesmanbacteria bacterium RBG_16_52_11]
MKNKTPITTATDDTAGKNRDETRQRFTRIARCPSCRKGKLLWNSRVVRCVTCSAWYPITDGVLQLVPLTSAYTEDRNSFREKVGKRYRLKVDRKTVSPESPQEVQRRHFDRYATDIDQSYNIYETMVFWRVIDRSIFDGWMKIIPKNAVILDVGCAQGRSAKPFVENKYTVIGFDIAKKMIEAGNSRFKDLAKPPLLFVGDATTIPVADGCADVVVLYGVLHHLPHPRLIAKEIARVLKPKGIFLSLENNRTPLRFLFDVLQRLMCLWDEKAGESPTMSAADVSGWFAEADMTVRTRTHVFLPPHLINILPVPVGYRITAWTDAAASRIPLIREWGGLIEIIGTKTNQIK